MIARRRYEILLPLELNDGSPVPERLLWTTVEELEAHCHAVSWESQIVRGIWEHEGSVFRDNNTRLILDVEDTSENRHFFASFKESLKARFQQIEIYISSYLIDVV
jgi:hypothetical protein